jgi:membrane-anchored protein YejM (alkaline phosphatase superfamily)
MITGDHGEEFNDGGQGFWGHNSAFSRPQTRVPLVVRWPGKGAGKINRLTSHSDVAPTVVGDILGYKNPASTYSNGRSLFDESPREFVITGSWDSFALAGDNFITVALPTGELEYRDSAYNPTSPSPASSKAMVASLEEMSRFFAK